MRKLTRTLEEDDPSADQPSRHSIFSGLTGESQRPGRGFLVKPLQEKRNEKHETLHSDKINCFNGRLPEMAVSQTASLSWDFLEDPLAEPQACRKLGHQAATNVSLPRDPEVCLNISRAEQAGSLSTVCHPCGRRGGEEIHFPTTGVFPWGGGREQVTLGIPTLTFTKKSDRHFSIIYRVGEIPGREIALNYNSL